jgi:hypothetical protein
MQYIKIGESILQVTKPVEIKSEIHEYTLDFLLSQKENILKQKNDFIEARDRELLEIDELLNQAETLGLKTQAELKVIFEEQIKEI